MMNVILAIVIGVVAVASFLYLAWDLISVWHARGWSGEEESQTEHGPSGQAETPFKTYGSADCLKYCHAHPYLTNVASPLGCEEVCRSERA